MQEHSDAGLIKLFREGKDQDRIFGLIVEKYKERLYRHIRSILIDHNDTDDILQDTFMKAWQALDTFREDSKLFTWLYRIATNESISFLRHKKRLNLLSFNSMEKRLSKKLFDDPYFNGDALQCKLQKAILKLPARQRIIFNMKYFNELKYEDISNILEISAGAAKASYYHAVRKIEKYLNAD